jgi:Tol biopolymer transport system component
MWGTPGYIAPEQLRGAEADHRADLFNVGAVLYEMLSGRRPFEGSSTTEILSAIENRDPMDCPEFAGAFGQGIGRLLRRCLEKNPHERFQSALDLAFDLEALLLPADAPRQSAQPGRVFAILAAALAIVLGAAWTGRKLERSNSRPPAVFQRLTYRLGVITGARFSPDGHSIIYSAGWDGKPVEIFRTRIEGPESQPLGYSPAGVLAVSPSGELAMSLGCELNWAECRGTLARMPLSGGAPRQVLEDVFYADWAPDGKTMAVVRAVDGRVRLEYPPGKTLYETSGWITYPRFSPKGDRIAFLDHPTLGEDDGSVALVDLDGRRSVISAGWKNLKGLAWAPTGKEIWFSGDRTARSQIVYAVTLSGRERQVLQAPGWMRLQDISREGRVLLLQASPRSRIVFRASRGAPDKDLSWFDWSTAADLSTDGRYLLFYEWGEGVHGNPTVYLRDTRGGDAVRLGEGRALTLSPDGKWALALRSGKPPRLVLLPTGPGEERLLAPSDLGELYSATWFPNGRRILFVAAGHDGQPRSYTQDIDAGAPQIIGDASEQALLVSPDGRLVAGIGPDGYRLRPAAGGAPVPIRGTFIGDELVEWSGDGRFLYVRGPGDTAFEFSRIELATGRRQIWCKVAAADPVGFIGLQQAAVRMTPDGMSFVYTYWKTLTEMYLVDGLQ